MRIRELPPDVARDELAAALEAVELANPGLTASTRGTRRRRVVLIAGAVAAVVLFALLPVPFAVTLTTAGTLMYLGTVVHRISLVRASLRQDPSIHVGDEEARALPDHLLPTYTLLVPAYGEPTVVAGLIAALERLEYPRDRLDVKLLLEADDVATVAAAHAVRSELPVEVLLVPPGEPRTKPRALDFGLRFARGSYVTIYDAEDHPEPLQLRRAVVAFGRSPSTTACLQARLSFYGGDRNLLTRWFTAEYATWFSLFLPGLMAQRAPIPLGGTSNHFTAEALHRVGGWDAHNVTEDCDLGIRLQRRGYTIGLLDSTTMEEPNTDVVNWVKQRSRWYKGYLQTFMVAFRRPRELVRDLGWRGVGQFVLFVGCTPLLAVMNLWFWALALVWIVTRASFVQAMYPGVAYYLAVLVWAIGNLSVVYLSVVTVRTMRRPELLVAALLSPLYWVLMSIAALRAAIELVTAPTHWDKTTHGLADPAASAAPLPPLPPPYVPPASTTPPPYVPDGSRP